MNRLRQIIRAIILDILGIFAKPAVGIHILNAHHLGKNPNPDVFRRQLTQLDQQVRFINFQEAVSLITSKTKVKETLVAFSFDDGFEECYSMIAPVLEEFGVNAAFFINPNFIDADEDYRKNFCNEVVKTPNKAPMSWKQLKDLNDRGFLIGAHTLDHYNINDDDKKELERQIGECKQVIEEKLHTQCDYFAFPFGKMEHANPQSIDLACSYYPYVFSQSDYKNYFSFGGKVINRRHFEPYWPVKHVCYFLSCEKQPVF